MITYNQMIQTQQRYAELNKPATQTEGWTHPCPNVIDRAVAALKASLAHKPAQTRQPVTHKPAGAH
jgi:hypothetical protein